MKPTPKKMLLGVTAVMLPELSFTEQISLCVKAGLKYYQYRPRIIEAAERSKPFSPWGNHNFDLTPERLAKEGQTLTRQLRDAGLEPWGTLPAMDLRNTDDEIRLHLDGCAASDAGSVRCGAFPYPQGPFNYTELLNRSLDRFHHIITNLSKPRNIKLIIETHCGSLAASPALALNLCRSFHPNDLGVIFDIANFGLEGAQRPNLAIAVLKDYIDCIHIGGTRRLPDPPDQTGYSLWKDQQCPMKEAMLHFPTWLKELKAAGVTAPLIIEDFRPTPDGNARVMEDAEILKPLLQ